MEQYSILREFADSWGLLLLMIAFIFVVLLHVPQVQPGIASGQRQHPVPA